MTEALEQQVISIMPSLSCLLQDLNEKGVRYCQWKSNIRLEESLRGDTDLDLLVDPHDLALFQQILKEYRVKSFRAAPGKEYPGISNYLGYDTQSGRLFHLHVHQALVLGEQFVKNYRLPLEQDFFEDNRLRLGVRTPRPEVELIVFVVRALLKYRDRDALKEIARVNLWGRKSVSGGLPGMVLREARWLLGQTTLANVQNQLTCWQNLVPERVVLEFLSGIDSGQLTGVQLAHLRSELRNSLSEYQRANRAWVTLRYFREDWRRKRKIFKRRTVKKMTREQGGLRLAFVGADGAGKSTVIEQVESWLSWRISVNTFYMGKSRSLLTTRLAKSGKHISLALHTRASQVFGSRSLITRLARQNQSFWTDVGYLAEAWERLRQYRRSEQEARAGAVVLYDRYPLPKAQTSGHAMDGPRISARHSGQGSSLSRRMARLEENWYRQIGSPELLIALQVSPEVSLTRKPEHEVEAVENKARALAAAASVVPGLVMIQADAPLQQVMEQVKAIVWELL